LSTKNAVLQAKNSEKFGKMLNLLVDIKTRWNSIVQMIEKFLLLKDCIKLALSELNLYKLMV
jgi:hypothetical protein